MTDIKYGYIDVRFQTFIGKCVHDVHTGYRVSCRDKVNTGKIRPFPGLRGLNYLCLPAIGGYLERLLQHTTPPNLYVGSRARTCV